MSERVTFADLLKKAEAKKLADDSKLIDNSDIPNQPNQPNIPKIDNQPNIPNQPEKNPIKKIEEISPSKDFTKVANSIAREAVPQRLFRGMSKNTYDALYARTRGAINPIRRIRATKSDLVLWAGVSDVTIDKHLKQLASAGLLKVEFMIGSHEGNWYEVYIPEEAGTDLTNLTNLTPPNIPKKVGYHIPKEVRYVGWGKTQENTDTYASPQTSLKTSTKNDDDKEARANAPFAEMIGKLNSAAKKITGRDSAKNEAEKWGSLADLLILELEKAAKQTEGISSVPAFLTEVLRRQFFASNRTKSKTPQNSAKTNGRTKSDQIGKPDEQSFEIKPLDEAGRADALAQLTEFADDDFLIDFQKWYAAEDWQWLFSRLRGKD